MHNCRLHRATLVVSILAFAILGCAQSPKPLLVGTTPNYPPLTFRQDGALAGIEIEFAERLEEELGRPVEIRSYPWSELFKALDAREIDVVMSGVSITKARSEIMLFSAPYLETSQVVLVRKGSFDSAGRLNDPGVTVGFEGSTTGADFVAEHLTDAKTRPFEDVDTAVRALRRGNIDAFVHDAPTIWRVTGRPLFEDDELEGIYMPLPHEQLAWAVHSDDESLKHALDQALARWEAEGWLRDVIDRWIPVRRRPVTR